MLSVVGSLVIVGSLILDHGSLASAADAPPPPAEITKIPITIYANSVIVVKGRMVEMDKLKEHLAALVPDAKKPGVEVTIFPNSKGEMGVVPEIVRIAKEAGYTNVSFESPKPVKELITEIQVLLSRTGAISVDGDGVKDEDLQAHLEKKVPAERREKVTVYIRFTRFVPMKKVGEVAKICRTAGFKDIVTGLIAE